MNNVLILDTETTGTEINNAEVIEIAGVLYSVKYKTILQQISTLLPVKENPAYHVNKISAETSHNSLMPCVDIIIALKHMANHANAIVAHNAEFDKKWMSTINCHELEEKQWICSLYDFEWPHTNAKKLVEIALAFDIPVISAHRALTDCILLAQCFSKVDDLAERLEKAAIPRFLYKANVPIAKKDLAKNAGFNWNQLIPGYWAKRMTEEQAAKIDFPIEKA